MKLDAKTKSVAIVGEVLFDHFPNGQRILGGAPFNVAWNLCGLGVPAMLLSSVGDDDDGSKILAEMNQWGLQQTGVRIDQASPTGSVTVATNQDGEPSYNIHLGVAYDALSVEHSLGALEGWKPNILYHGSLCFRTENNREYLRQLKQFVFAKRFVDLNLREPWTDRAWIAEIIEGCQWLKMSSEELAWLSGAKVNAADESSVQAAVDSMQLQTNLESRPTYLITCGKHGAHWIDDRISLHRNAKELDQFVDSVGAGDAFSAAVIRGIVQNDTPQSILADAVHFASLACTIQGATSLNRDHYRMDRAPSRLPFPN